MQPTLGNGKICYIVIPSKDIRQSVDFYTSVFGWNVRQRGDGSMAFDDGVGQVSGTWQLDTPPAAQPGFTIYVMVDSVAASCDAIIANGGEIVQAADPNAREIAALFRDPAGNVMGVYQHPA